MQGIRAGQTLVIGNKDPVGHNTKADFFTNTPFNDLIPAGGIDRKRRLPKPKAQPSPISCSIHPWMNAYLLIREDPYFADQRQGRKIRDQEPAGRRAHVRGVEQQVHLQARRWTAKRPMWARGRVKINIKAGANSLGKVEVTPSERPTSRQNVNAELRLRSDFDWLLRGHRLAAGCARYVPPAERVDTTNVVALRKSFGGGAARKSTAGSAAPAAEPTGWATLKGTFKLERHAAAVGGSVRHQGPRSLRARRQASAKRGAGCRFAPAASRTL